jgi:uncharacterized protein (TIGR03086 family)
MSEVSTRYARVAAGFTMRVEGVPSDAWSAPTPCREWTVRQLVTHVVNTHRRVMATLEETEPVDADPDADLLGQWLEARAAVTDALDDEARASKLMNSDFGEQSFASLVGRLVCADTLTHTWDLARATGQDESLDAEAVARAHEVLTPIDEPMRGPGGFAPKITPPPGADAQTEFLNFCGRSAGA